MKQVAHSHRLTLSSSHGRLNPLAAQEDCGILISKLKNFDFSISGPRRKETKMTKDAF